MTTFNQNLNVQTTASLAFRPEVLHYSFPQTLVERLSAEQRWSAEYTERVLTEYRRFVNLAATGTGGVTPSQTVDEAWHLHLTFTRDYWERLVPLLPGPLHHEPADGSAGDAEKYRQQYLDTLDRYAALYGERPPLDIWPAAPRSRPPERLEPDARAARSAGGRPAGEYAVAVQRPTRCRGGRADVYGGAVATLAD